MEARKLEDILAQIRQSWVENFTMREIYGLDPAKTFAEQFSAVSLESIITYLFAYAAWLYEQIVYDKAKEVESHINEQHEFSIPWYLAKAKDFQLGDVLVFDENTYRFVYPVVDESKQLVKHVAVRERQVDGVTKLQIYATKSNKEAMNTDELNAFSSYIRQIGAAGTHFEFISLAPDILEINATVYYNPQLLSASGISLMSGENTVEIAIRDYLNGIMYSGKFNRSRLTDSIQEAVGVRDVILGDVRLNEDLNNAREFESQSGFFVAQTINITYMVDHGN